MKLKIRVYCTPQIHLYNNYFNHLYDGTHQNHSNVYSL